MNNDVLSLHDEAVVTSPSQSPAESKKHTANNRKNSTTTINTTKSWKPTILVVDDSATNRKMLVRSLMCKGLFTCREAEDGVEALSIITLSMNARQRKVGALLQRFSRKDANDNTGSPRTLKGLVANAMQQQRVVIDAVLIDSNMPRMNGQEAIVEMRKMGYHGTIIGVSGGDDETMRQFMQAGADSVMQKPAKTDHLVKFLMDGLRKSVQLINEGDHHDGEEVGAVQTHAPISSPTINNPTISSVVSNMAHISRLRKFIADTDAVAAAAAATATAAASTGGGNGASQKRNGASK